MQTNETVKLTIAQANFVVGDVHSNTQQVIQLAKHAREHKAADIILFPELTLTGYPPEDLLFRRELKSHLEQAISLICQQVAGITVVIGYPEYADDVIYNAALVIQNQQVIANYRKQCLPNYGVFDEKRYFAPGPATACCFSINNIRFGVCICEDVWYQAPAALSKQAGAEFLLTMHASPFDMRKHESRLDVAMARAQENRLPLAYAHWCAGQDEVVFDGGSFILNAAGKICEQAPFFTNHLLSTEITKQNNSIVLDKNNIIDHPSTEHLLYQALKLGVKDYIEKNSIAGVIIGLSGGIDSALTLAIAVDALGKDAVSAYMLPSRYTSDMSRSDAAQLANNLGVDYEEISIEPCYQALQGILAKQLEAANCDIAEQNLQARCRSNILMTISNTSGRILLNTGNKSELAVGYSTLYGDMAGGFAVLKDVPKMWVYRLAKYRNTIAADIPSSIISRAPSAELKANQTDQDSLPDYQVLDEILERYIEREETIEEITQAGFDASVVKQVIELVFRNEHKRRQSAPGIKVTGKAFGRDRRFPITTHYLYETNKIP